MEVADESGDLPHEWLIVVNGDGTGISTSDGEEASFTQQKCPGSALK